MTGRYKSKEIKIGEVVVKEGLSDWAKPAILSHTLIAGVRFAF